MNSGNGNIGRVAKLYRTFLPYLKPYSSRLTLAYAALVAYLATVLLEPWPLKLTFDHVLFDKPLPDQVRRFTAIVGTEKPRLLVMFCLGLVLIVLLKSFLSFLNKFLLSAVGQGVTNDIRLGLVDHVHSLSLAALGSRKKGDLVLRLTSDIKALQDLLVTHIQNCARDLLSFLSTIIVMLWMDWKLTALSLVVVPPLWILSYHLSVRIKLAVQERQRKEGEVASLVEETMTSMAVVQAFSQERREKNRLAIQSNESLRASLRGTRLGKAFNQLVNILNGCGVALVVWYGAMRALRGQLTPGDLIVFVTYARNMYSPIDSLSEFVVEFMQSIVSGERLLELIETSTQVKEDPQAIEAPPFSGEVRFEDIVFGYRTGEPVLRNLSITVTAGQTVALTGSNGAGKSSILKLLLRFFDPWTGRILIDGQDVRHFKLRSLREQMSIVLQESILFRRTIRENIAYGNPKVGFEEIVSAAKTAHCHDFIANLPNGYDTVLDDAGRSLSGGQGQKICLARAILRNAPIIILDEPWTGLDPIAELQVREALATVTRGKTTFIIAHRLSTIRGADLILLMEEGKIVEQGTHAELLANSVAYRRLYDLQFGQHEVDRGPTAMAQPAK